MGKYLKRMQLQIRDTAIEGEPDEIEVYYDIGHTDDPTLNKSRSYIVGKYNSDPTIEGEEDSFTPDCTEGLDEIWSVEKGKIKDYEGIV